MPCVHRNLHVWYSKTKFFPKASHQCWWWRNKFCCVKKCFCSKTAPAGGWSSAFLESDRQALCDCGRQEWGDKSRHRSTVHRALGKLFLSGNHRGDTEWFLVQIAKTRMAAWEEDTRHRNILPYELNQYKKLSLGFRLNQTSLPEIFHNKTLRK